MKEKKEIKEIEVSFGVESNLVLFGRKITIAKKKESIKLDFSKHPLIFVSEHKKALQKQREENKLLEEENNQLRESLKDLPKILMELKKLQKQREEIIKEIEDSQREFPKPSINYILQKLKEGK